MNFNDNPAPIPNSNDSLWEMLIDYSRKVYPPVREEILEMMKQRNDFGIQKYGTPLQVGNGRSFKKDALEEALDLMVYLYGHTLESTDPDKTSLGDYFLGNVLEIVEFLFACLEE